MTAPTPESRRIACMEVWGGHEAFEGGVSVPGNDVFVSCSPHTGDVRGGDIYYVSNCAAGIISRFVLADVAGHGSVVSSTASGLRDLMRRYINTPDQTKFARALNRRFSSDAGRFATAVLVSYFAPTDHAIICGHGPVGEKLNKALLDSGVRTLVVELNAETVQKLKRQGQAVLFADASHAETWELTQLKNARMVALTFPDATVNAQALAMIREHRPDISVLARARFNSDVERLKRLGATQVVNDETEASRAMEDAALTLQGA